MAVAFVRSGTRSQASPAATISPAKPTVDGIGGVLLANVTSKNNAAHSCPTSGWSMVGTQQNSGASFTSSLWIAAEGAAAPTFNWTGSVACSAQIAYYNDVNNALDTAVAAISASTGSSNPHTGTSITATRANSRAILVDVAASNTSLTTPTGWTGDVSNGSATDGGRTTFCSKALTTVGSTSGSTSSNGGAAAWVQWQLELRDAAATELDVAKVESLAWIEGAPALSAALVESVAWLDGGNAQLSKIEGVTWLDAGTFQISKAEVVTWLDAGVFQVSKVEMVAWLEAPGVVNSRRRMSLM